MERMRKPPIPAGSDEDVSRRKTDASKSKEESPEDSRSGGSCEAETLSRIADGIARMDYPPVPADFLASVMQRVQSSKMPWWYRLYRWAKSQHTVRITPLKLAPAAVVFLFVGYGLLAVNLPGEKIQPSLRAPLSEAGMSVTFELKMPGARSVNLVGSFNGWSPGSCEMKRSGEATWTVVLQLPVGHYEYAFLVDGRNLVIDPGGEFYQDDGFGNRNNILVVGNNHEGPI